MLCRENLLGYRFAIKTTVGWWGGVYDYSWLVWGNLCTKLELAGVVEEKGKRGREK